MSEHFCKEESIRAGAVQEFVPTRRRDIDLANREAAQEYVADLYAEGIGRLLRAEGHIAVSPAQLRLWQHSQLRHGLSIVLA